MSENAFYLVPTDPFYVPSEEQRLAALEFFREVSPHTEAWLSGDSNLATSLNFMFLPKPP